jgi:PncC family amidohydrolase
MSTGHLVISESGRLSLATAGLSTGWLMAWMRMAGIDRVRLHALEGIDWSTCRGWRVVIAAEDELMRVAVAHGKHIGAAADGTRRVVNAEAIEMENPARCGWHYRQEGAQTLLLPLGELAYQRDAWLSRISDGQPFDALQVALTDAGGDVLERGLVAWSPDTPLPEKDILLNDQGYLPEEQLLMALNRHRLQLRCAESCTAGGIASRIARVPGASSVLERSWVTYSNEAKAEELGVNESTIGRYGAVSRETVIEMATGGAGERAACIAVSGIAGPGGGSTDKPVGTVWMAIAVPGLTVMPYRFLFSGSRADIQHKAVLYAMAMLIRRLEMPGA